MTAAPTIVVTQDVDPYIRRRSSAVGGDADPSRTRILDGLRHHDLFASVPSSALHRAARLFETKVYRAGDEVTRYGMVGSSMFFVLSGVLKVVDDAQEARLCEIGSGMFFGEAAAVLSARRMATVTVQSRTASIALIGKESLRQAVGEAAWDRLVTHAVSLYETALTGRHEFGRSLELKLGELGRYQQFVKADQLRLQALIDAGGIQKMAYGGNCLVHVRHQGADAFGLVVASGKIGVFRRERVEPVRVLRSGMSWSAAQDAGDYLRALQESKVVVLAESLHSCKSSDGQRQPAVVPGAESILRALSENDTLGCELINRPRTRPLEIGHDTRVVFCDDLLVTSRSHVIIGRAACLQDKQKAGRRSTGNMPSPLALGSSQATNARMLKSLVAVLDYRFDLASRMLASTNTLDCSWIAEELDDVLLGEIVAVLDEEIEAVLLKGCSRLTRIPRLPEHVRRVDLTDCWSVESFEHLQGVPSVCLSNCQGLTTAQFDLLGPKTSIDASHCHMLTDSCIHKLLLLNSQLERLSIHRCTAITDAAFDGSFRLDALKSVDCSECPFVTERGIAGLLDQAPSLEQLDISFCGVKDLSLLHLNDKLRAANIAHLDCAVNLSTLTERCRDSLEQLTISGDRCSTWSALKRMRALRKLTVIGALKGEDRKAIENMSVEGRCHRQFTFGFSQPTLASNSTLSWYEQIALAIEQRDAFVHSAYYGFAGSYSFVLQRLKSTNALNCDLQGQNEALRRRVDEQLPSADGGEVNLAKYAQLERKLQEAREERVELYRMQGINAQRLLTLNEQLKGKEKEVRDLHSRLEQRKSFDAGFEEQVGEYRSMVEDKDVALRYMQDELTKLQLELLETEERCSRLRNELRERQQQASETAKE